jgi:CheY-like chemotaxis protein
VAHLELARRLVPDLILLDAHMPGIDDFDVCRSLKAEAPFRHVPIVFITRHSDVEYEMRAFDLGAAAPMPSCVPCANRRGASALQFSDAATELEASQPLLLRSEMSLSSG